MTNCIQIPSTLCGSEFANQELLPIQLSPCPDVTQDVPPSERSTQADSKVTKKKKKKSSKKTKKVKKQIIFNVSDTKYEIVKHVGEKIFQWKLSYEPNGEWDVFWTDGAVSPDVLAKMHHYQKINHFPGKHLMRLRKAFPNEYKFFPLTYLLPTEYTEFRAQFANKTPTFIVKPEASCQGRGIFLTKTYESIQPGERYVVQKYLKKPYLIDGLKFDLRVYVLLAGCDPMRIYLYNDGLARFATEKYVQPSGKNLENMCMHLTNYAVNKKNPNFVFNTSEDNFNQGHKRSLKALMKTLAEQGHDVEVLWKEIKKLVIKTFCSVQPILAHNYRSCQPDDMYNNMCFEVLGGTRFDIMLDHKLRPYLLEVNHTPSFTTDTPLDWSIKKNVIHDALKLMNISAETKYKYKKKKRIELRKRILTGKTTKYSPEERRTETEKAQMERDEWESRNLGDFEKIYPIEDPLGTEENYEAFLKEAYKWWETWTGTTQKRFEKRSSYDMPKPPLPNYGLKTPSNKLVAASTTNRDLQSPIQNPPLLKPRRPAYSARPSSSHTPYTNTSLKIDAATENEIKTSFLRPIGNDRTIDWLEKEDATRFLFVLPEDEKEEEEKIDVDVQGKLEKNVEQNSITEEDLEDSDKDCIGEDDEDDEYPDNLEAFEPKEKNLEIKSFVNDSFENRNDQPKQELNESLKERALKQRDEEKSHFFRIRPTQQPATPKEVNSKPITPSGPIKPKSLSVNTKNTSINKIPYKFGSGKVEEPQILNPSKPCFTEIYGPNKKVIAKPNLIEFEKDKSVVAPPSRNQIQSQSSHRSNQTIGLKPHFNPNSSATKSQRSNSQALYYVAPRTLELKIITQEATENHKELDLNLAIQGHRPGSRTFVKNDILLNKIMVLNNLKAVERVPNTINNLSPQTFIKRK